MNKLKALWGSLPHPVQAIIVAVATAAGTTFLRSLSDGMCFSSVCLKHDAASAIAAGLAAARAFYMVPNKPPAQVVSMPPPAAHA